MGNVFAELVAPPQAPAKEKRKPASLGGNIFADLVSGPSSDRMSSPPPQGDPQGMVVPPTYQTPDVVIPSIDIGDPANYGSTFLSEDTFLPDYGVQDQEIVARTAGGLDPYLNAYNKQSIGIGGIVH